MEAVKYDTTESEENRVSIQDKVSFLKNAEAYPHPVSQVETRETHMSWVFLAGAMAYKIKKPVVYRLLDFRTLEARFKNCQEEFRINKRLAKDIYIGLVPLVLNDEGRLQIDGKGQVIEWMVKMKRIQDDALLEYAINQKKADKALLKGAADLLAAFYHDSPAIHVKPILFRQKLKDEITYLCIELLNAAYDFPVSVIVQISNKLTHFLIIHSLLFDERMAKGRIIEAHGDLRPEHICLGPEPAIIDALEFEKELRIMDIAKELAFLDMECEFLGDNTAGKFFIEIYGKACNDIIPPQLLVFYKTQKALLRTYLVARHILEPDYRNDPKWLKKANRYLQLAEKYSKLLPP